MKDLGSARPICFPSGRPVRPAAAQTALTRGMKTISNLTRVQPIT